MMNIPSSQGGVQIACPNCRQPMNVNVEQVVDATRDPNAKARLISGRMNVFTCPNCGFQSRLATPLMYHDQSKELLMLYVPMELGLPKQEQERLIGSMTQAIINSIPQEQRKGYLFTPKQALTLQGLIETVLENDGITKEMLEARKQKVKLIETLLQTDPAQWPQLAKDNDAMLDREFFEVLTASAEAAIANGRRDVAEQLLMLRDQLLQNSTVGKELVAAASEQEATIQRVAQRLNELGANATLDDVINLTIELGKEDEQQLQALVGLARPVLNYRFFETLTKRIEAESDPDEAAKITSIRDRLVELTSMIDQANQQVVDQAVNTLREIINAPDLDQAIEEHLDVMDDMFMQVLQANIEHSEKNNDQVTAARLKTVLEKVMVMMNQAAPPAVQFINDVLQMPTHEMQKQEMALRAPEFGQELLEWFDTLIENINEQNGDPMMKQTLSELREIAAKSLSLEHGEAAPAVAPNVVNFEARSAPTPPPAPSAPAAPPVDGGDTSSSGIVLPFSARKRKNT
ncbi:MAG: hypothetical protein KF716_18235 [Anaerolineae bacterium]|nr:hypothetical protein [Anaerolineae bacterium]